MGLDGINPNPSQGGYPLKTSLVYFCPDLAVCSMLQLLLFVTATMAAICLQLHGSFVSAIKTLCLIPKGV